MTKSPNLSKIEHFVILMLENRSFDHMLGYLYADKGGFLRSKSEYINSSLLQTGTS